MSFVVVISVVPEEVIGTSCVSVCFYRGGAQQATTALDEKYGVGWGLQIWPNTVVVYEYEYTNTNTFSRGLQPTYYILHTTRNTLQIQIQI